MTLAISKTETRGLLRGQTALSARGSIGGIVAPRGWTEPDRTLEGLVDEYLDKCVRVYNEYANRV